MWSHTTAQSAHTFALGQQSPPERSVSRHYDRGRARSGIAIAHGADAKCREVLLKHRGRAGRSLPRRAQLSPRTPADRARHRQFRRSGERGPFIADDWPLTLRQIQMAGLIGGPVFLLLGYTDYAAIGMRPAR